MNQATDLLAAQNLRTSALAVAGAFPPNSIIAITNNTFIGAVGTAGGNGNNWGYGWLNSWPIAAAYLAAQPALCSVCIVNTALIGTGARLTVSENAFQHFFDSMSTNNAGVFVSEILLEGQAAANKNTFSMLDVNNNPALYRQNLPAGGVNFSSVKFITPADAPATDPKDAPSITANGNEAWLSTPNWYWGVGRYYWYGFSNLMSSAPVVVLLNYTNATGTPTAPPEGYVLTGGNITISNNTAGGNMMVNTNPPLLANWTSNMQFNVSMVQDADTAYSLPIALRFHDNAVYGQPQYPYTFIIRTSRLTTGTTIDISRNYYKGSAYTQGYNLFLAPYYTPLYNNVQKTTPFYSFAALHFVDFTLNNDTAVSIVGNAYEYSADIPKRLTNFISSPMQLPTFTGQVTLPFSMGPETSLYLSNNYAGNFSFDSTANATRLLAAYTEHNPSACQISPGYMWTTAIPHPCAVSAANSMDAECAECTDDDAGRCGTSGTMCKVRFFPNIAIADVCNAGIYTPGSSGGNDYPGGPGARRVFNLVVKLTTALPSTPTSPPPAASSPTRRSTPSATATAPSSTRITSSLSIPRRRAPTPQNSSSPRPSTSPAASPCSRRIIITLSVS